ncbi:MAG: hypothetical protein L3J23_04065 [Flavobacteriaceae bacterium]|nr:hypothetical protein [Flavobacteriaceae bacterium]
MIEGEELIQSKEDAALSKYLDKDKKTFKILQLTTQKNKIKLPFTVKQGKGSWLSWFQDNNGFLEPKLSIEDTAIKIISNTKIFTKYNSEIEVEIEMTAKESKEFYLDFYANDDKNYFYNKDKYKNIHCGRLKISFNVVDADVFRKSEIKKFLLENKKAQIFNKTGNVVGNGYCINSADRTLGALLNDTTNFYTEPNLIAQGGNGIRLESSRSRAKMIKSLGYIENFKEVRTDNYNSFKAPSVLITSLKNIIKKDINNRKGYHVYYFSMHGEYHVMLLLINFSNLNNPTFSILDQGYVDQGNSRNLDFNKIDDTFLTLSKTFWGNKPKYAKNILLWKIKKNQ